MATRLYIKSFDHGSSVSFRFCLVLVPNPFKKLPLAPPTPWFLTAISLKEQRHHESGHAAILALFCPMRDEP